VRHEADEEVSGVAQSSPFYNSTIVLSYLTALEHTLHAGIDRSQVEGLIKFDERPLCRQKRPFHNRSLRE
jgi:hypothetical protein